MHVWVVLVSVAGIAVVILLIFIASKTAKNEKVWQKLDDTASIVHPCHGIVGRRTRRKLIERAKPPVVSGGPNSETVLRQKSPHTAWEDSSYCWVVICKNHWVHRRQNLFHGHRILLGVTDGIASRPRIHHLLRVRCDDCGKEYLYKSSQVLRYEQEPPESFTPHPLFKDED